MTLAPPPWVQQQCRLKRKANPMLMCPGRSYSVFSQRMLNQCLESLVQKIQSGVVIKFEKTGPDPPPLEGKRLIPSRLLPRCSRTSFRHLLCCSPSIDFLFCSLAVLFLLLVTVFHKVQLGFVIKEPALRSELPASCCISPQALLFFASS